MSRFLFPGKVFRNVSSLHSCLSMRRVRHLIYFSNITIVVLFYFRRILDRSMFASCSKHWDQSAFFWRLNNLLIFHNDQARLFWPPKSTWLFTLGNVVFIQNSEKTRKMFYLFFMFFSFFVTFNAHLSVSGKCAMLVLLFPIINVICHLSKRFSYVAC